MTIENGYDSKPTRISVDAQEGSDKVASLNISQEGVQHWLLGRTLKSVKEGKKYKTFEVVQDHNGNRFVRGEQITHMQGQETLAYITIDELVELRDECNKALKQLVGVW